MRNSSLLKWAQNNKNSNKDKTGDGKESGNEKKWIHAPETLLQGHVVYLVKFLGCTEVDKPKGIEVVKQGIQKLKFNQQLTKKSESGGKTPKAELTISVEGVAIQEPKTKKMLHKYPLHKISYCADDKAEKRFFSFIAKEDPEEGKEEVKHTCFVFVSDKLAEEITLTIGQAFELAYKKFLDTNTKELETKKSLLVLQKRVALLERENGILKTRLRDVSSIKGQQDVQEYMHRNDITGDICDVGLSGPSQSASSTEASPSNTLNPNTPPPKAAHTAKAAAGGNTPQKPDELICLEATATKLDGFSLDDLNDDDFNPRMAGNNSDSDSDENEFNPRAQLPVQPPVMTSTASAAVLLAPPPALPPREKNSSAPTMSAAAQAKDGNIFANDPFGSSNPFSGDPFGMNSFEAKAGGEGSPAPVFQTGVATANFSLDELDPFKK